MPSWIWLAPLSSWHCCRAGYDWHCCQTSTIAKLHITETKTNPTGTLIKASIISVLRECPPHNHHKKKKRKGRANTVYPFSRNEKGGFFELRFFSNRDQMASLISFLVPTVPEVSSSPTFSFLSQPFTSRKYFTYQWLITATERERVVNFLAIWSLCKGLLTFIQKPFICCQATVQQKMDFFLFLFCLPVPMIIRAVFGYPELFSNSRLSNNWFFPESESEKESTNIKILISQFWDYQKQGSTNFDQLILLSNKL